MNKPFLSLTIAALALPAAWCRAEGKPNFVLFISDDHGYLDSTPYGATDVRTPHMARLAQQGLLLTNAFVASPSCAPSRASLLTGLMPCRNGAMPNHARPRDALKKLPAFLQELGYVVAAFGKVAHYGQDKYYGFDHYDGKNDAETVGAWLARRDAAKPLCLLVGTHRPHLPWPENAGYDPAALRLPPTFVDTPETRAWRTRYLTAVTVTDTEVGAIYDLAHDRLGANTLFLYTSDNGAQWPFGKWNLYDAGTRMPMLIAWPGVIRPGTRSEAMVSWTDILPTLVDLAGGKPPAGIDGRSFAAVLRGEKPEHRDRIFTTHSRDGQMNVYPCRAVRTQQWKYIRNLGPETQHTTHIDKPNAKDPAKAADGTTYWRTWVEKAKTDAAAAAIVARYHTRPAEELYDLKADPFEQHNLAADPRHAATLAQLRGEVDTWMHEQGDEGLKTELSFPARP